MPSGTFDARLEEIRDQILDEAGSVHHAMHGAVVSCGLDASVHDALGLMFAHNIGVLPIVDERRRVVGIATDRDLARAVYLAGRSPARIPMAEAMTTPAYTIGQHAPIRLAVSALRAHHIRRLPVVDDEERLVGLLSLDDLARELSDGPARKAADVTAALADIMSEPH
jgi:CBS domain-containing protein